MKKTLMDVVREYSHQGPGCFQLSSVLNEAANRLRVEGSIEEEQALLTIWNDLFRIGYLAWGYNLANPDSPFCHITDAGRKALEHLSRDPANPDGYLAYLATKASLNPVAQSYITEALTTYNSNCYKATAVMTGAATESIILQVRDTLVSRLQSLSRKPSKALSDWKIKKVLDALRTTLDAVKSELPRNLLESYEAYWSAFTHQIRVARNESGHPQSIEPITSETVHSSLLIFPELASLSEQLENWIKASYP